LRKSEVVGVNRQSAANQAWMLGDEFNVISITHAAGFRTLVSLCRLVELWRFVLPLFSSRTDEGC
jgi:hypothetical protein